MSPIEVDLLQDELVRVERAQPEPEHAFPPRFDAALQEPPRKPSGTCPICNEREANRHCLHCERDVCAQDHWVMLGLCKACVTRQEMEAARTPDRRRPDLDIKWIED